MKDKMGVIFSAVPLLGALIAAGAVLFWAPPCSGLLELANGNMVPMRCSYAGKTALLIALILAVVSAGSLISKRPAALSVALLSAALILVTFTTPLSGGICVSEDMACHTMALWLRLSGAVSLAAIAVAAVFNPARKRVSSL